MIVTATKQHYSAPVLGLSFWFVGEQRDKRDLIELRKNGEWVLCEGFGKTM